MLAMVLVSGYTLHLALGAVDRLDETCNVRQTGREAIRHLFMQRDDWTPADQAYMDEFLKESAPCP